MPLQDLFVSLYGLLWVSDACETEQIKIPAKTGWIWTTMVPQWLDWLFVTSEMNKNWNEALHTTLVTEDEIRSAYKMFHLKEFTVQERDKILKLLTRKTL